MIYFLFVLGFVLLIKGADWLVDGAGAIARKFRVSDIVIGLTVVSFGTSLPELIVNIFASFRESADMAIGNILGSNISNILLIVGVASMIYPLSVQKNTIRYEIPFSLFGSVLIGFLANYNLLNENLELSIHRVDGIILLTFFTSFMYYIGTIAKDEVIKDVDIPLMPLTKSVLLIVLGIVGLGLGGHWIVKGGVEIATRFGLSESLVGLTVIAIGTSLPELATSAVAAYKKNADIAVGNVVGSNVFNLFWILGASAIIKPLPYNQRNNLDIGITILVTILLFAFIFIGRERSITKWKGILFVLFYITYIAFAVYRG